MDCSQTSLYIPTPRVYSNSCPLSRKCHPTISSSVIPFSCLHSFPASPCPSPSTEVCPISCPLLWWCHPAISSSDALFSFCPQSFPASGTFPMSWLFTSGDQNTGASASASVWALTRAKMLPWLLLGPVAICRSCNRLQSVCARQFDNRFSGCCLMQPSQV